MERGIIFLFGLLIGACVVYMLMRKRHSISSIAAHAEKQQTEKQSRKGKIVELLREKETVTNNEIEALLGVADITATRYLQELEDEGLVGQVGKTGRSVSYRLKGS